MKLKSQAVIITVLTLLVLALFGNPSLFRPTATAQKNDKAQKPTNQTEPVRFSKDGKKNKKQIPDKVAYELFLRTVGEFNARGLVKRAGFSDDEVERIIGAAKSLNQILGANEKAARQIR